MKLTLILSLSLLFTITILSGFNFADAAKSSGTANPRIGVDICGDRLCDAGENMTPQEKLAYYLLSLIEFDDSTVIQQSRFSVGGVAQQSSVFASGSSDIPITQFQATSIIDRGQLNSMAVQISEPTLKVGIAQALPRTTPQGDMEIATTTEPKFEFAPQPTLVNRLNVGTLDKDKFAKIINQANVLPGKIDLGQIQMKCDIAPCGSGSFDDLRLKLGEARVAQKELEILNKKPILKYIPRPDDDTDKAIAVLEVPRTAYDVENDILESYIASISTEYLGDSTRLHVSSCATHKEPLRITLYDRTINSISPAIVNIINTNTQESFQLSLWNTANSQFKFFGYLPLDDKTVDGINIFTVTYANEDGIITKNIQVLGRNTPPTICVSSTEYPYDAIVSGFVVYDFDPEKKYKVGIVDPASIGLTFGMWTSLRDVDSSERIHSFRSVDPLGEIDPPSTSKHRIVVGEPLYVSLIEQTMDENGHYYGGTEVLASTNFSLTDDYVYPRPGDPSDLPVIILDSDDISVNDCSIITVIYYDQNRNTLGADHLDLRAFSDSSSFHHTFDLRETKTNSGIFSNINWNYNPPLIQPYCWNSVLINGEPLFSPGSVELRLIHYGHSFDFDVPLDPLDVVVAIKTIQLTE